MDSTINIYEKLNESEIASGVELAATQGAHIKTVRLHGDYPFHAHIHTDEVFIILDGCLEMDREGLSSVEMATGDTLKIDAGLRHRTRAKTHVLSY